MEFRTPDSFVRVMEDPSRVVRLEWRRVLRSEHKGLTSHSMVEAYLADGSRVRFERFVDSGLSESRFEPSMVDAVEGEVYCDRSVGFSELLKPFASGDLRMVAVSLCRRPYSLRNNNCHHLARDLWNYHVIKSRRISHYPDRVKSGLLRGVSQPLTSMRRVWSIGAQPEIELDLSGDDASEDGNSPPLRRSASFPSGVHISARSEEAGRVSGDFTAMSHASEAFSLQQRLQEFEKHLSAGSVYLLEPGKALVSLASPSPGLAVETAWLPGGDVPSSGGVLGDMGVAVRLASRIAKVDILDLIRSLPAVQQEDTCDRSAADRKASWFGSLASNSLQSLGPEPSIGDMCFVVLRAESEIRLAIYAVLMPSGVHPGSPRRRIRLLSGNAKQSEDGVFRYSICWLPCCKDDSSLVSAIDLVHNELQALLTAVTTGEWGFVTLM